MKASMANAAATFNALPTRWRASPTRALGSRPARSRLQQPRSGEPGDRDQD
jgi:hypothetical protein